MMYWKVLFELIVYLVALTGTDRMVTGVIKPDVKKMFSELMSYGKL